MRMRISAWFDRHMKTRIALQLALDGLPMLLLVIPFLVLALELDGRLPAGWWDVLGIGCMYIVFFGGGALLFVLGILFRSLARIEFECYPWCKAASDILRILSIVPAVVSFGFLIGITVLWIKNL